MGSVGCLCTLKLFDPICLGCRACAPQLRSAIILGFRIVGSLCFHKKRKHATRLLGISGMPTPAPQQQLSNLQELPGTVLFFMESMDECSGPEKLSGGIARGATKTNKIVAFLKNLTFSPAPSLSQHCPETQQPNWHACAAQ